MENVTERLNAVVNHIESHLDEAPDKDVIASIAACSYSDVTRVFSNLAEFSLAEYIRKRRLAQAGIELKYDGAKVIDVALKHGYDSPVSFARAFREFHGVNPGEVGRDTALRSFPRIAFNISVRAVQDPIRYDELTVDGRTYRAEYHGEIDLSAWSSKYKKREYWRIVDALGYFADKPFPYTAEVLPYNNYPPIDIHIGDVFVIDMHRFDGAVERVYYIADGTFWQDMPCTRLIIMNYLDPIRIDEITVNGKAYKAEYFGKADISSWSEPYISREFRRIICEKSEFESFPRGGDLLPYNNYPPLNIRYGDVFQIVYEKRGGGTETHYYTADGTVWCDMPSTRLMLVTEDNG